MSSSGRLPIEVEVHGDRVRKTFHRELLGHAEAHSRFSRECAAYDYLHSLGTEFVPRVLCRDEDALCLETERVADGRTVIDWLNTAKTNSFEPVIAELVSIDKYLYQNRVNYLGGSPMDILVGEDYRLFLIDFEHTWCGERAEDCLYDRMLHTRLDRVTDSRKRAVFERTLMSRRSEFHRYGRRRATRLMNHWLGLGRARKLAGR